MKSLELLLLVIFSISYVYSAEVFTLNIQCAEDPDCKPNAFCYKSISGSSRGVCRCSKGYTQYSNTSYYECALAKNLREGCDLDFQCQEKAGTFAVCNPYKICACTPDAHEGLGGTCYRTAKLTEPCINDQNCKLADGLFGICTYEHCDCEPGYRPSLDKYHCLKSLELGDKCSNETECELISNAQCAPSGKCECKREFAISRDGRTCLRVANDFGGDCIEDLQCSRKLFNSTCLNRQCSCEPGFHKYGNECIKTAKINENCRENENCVWEEKLKNNVECSQSEGVCKCIHGESDAFYGCEITDSGDFIRPGFYFITIILTVLLIFSH